MWYVYILKCSDDTFYTGVTIDIERRISEHNNSDKGAKYTRMRRPVNLVYQSNFGSRTDACKEEYRIKQLNRKEKESMVIFFKDN